MDRFFANQNKSDMFSIFLEIGCDEAHEDLKKLSVSSPMSFRDGKFVRYELSAEDADKMIRILRNAGFEELSFYDWYHFRD